MTKEEFSNLSIDKQDEFLNSGAIFLESTVVSDVSTIQEIPKVESENGVILPPDSVKDEVLINSPQPSDPFYDGFDIKDPVELLFFLDDSIMTGKVKLHDWQILILLDFASADFTDMKAFQAVVRACNGSGKDKFIIAACAVWLCMRYRLARGIITSSSGVQLDNQTCYYIKMLCEAANRKWGNVWKCNYREYRCLPVESAIICYATDEPKKAEGFHPAEWGRKMGIFVSEDKTVPDEINVAINKCTGYTHRVHVSTPGLPMGHFYDYCSTAVDRKSVKRVTDVRPEDYIQYHVTAYDCTHISKSYIEQMKRDLPGGEFGAAFKSQVLAEFGTTDEMVVIPYTYVWRAVNQTVDHIPEAHNKAGLDLSDGGDETVLVVRNGNKMLKVIPFRFDNTEDTIAFLNDKFKENNLTHHDALIFADCGGLGKPMLDRMKRQGWSNIRYMDNRSKPQYPATYRNRGAELWFQFSKLLQNNELSLCKDDKMVRQLSTRYYKTDGRIHQLLSKPESRSRGYPSPDRADACVLAFSDYKSTFISKFEEEENKPQLEKEEEVQEVVGDLTLKGHARGFNNFNPSKYITDKQKDLTDVKAEIEQYNKRLQLTKN